MSAANLITEDALASLELIHYRTLYPKWSNYDYTFNTIENRFNHLNETDPERRKKMKRLVEKARKMKTYAEAADAANAQEILTEDGRVFTMSHTRTIQTLDGEVLIGKNDMFIKISNLHSKKIDDAQMMIYGLEFKSETEKSKIGPLLPQYHTSMKLTDDFRGIGCTRTGRVRLLDYLEKYEGKNINLLWIVTRLFEVTEFLERNGIIHNAIMKDSVWVDPVNQYATLNGGWRSATKFDVNAPVQVANGLDQIAIVSLGRDLIGGEVVPEPIFKFLNGLPSESAKENLAEWKKVLKLAKVRRFAKVSYFDADSFYA